MELHREDVTLLDRAKIQSEVVVPLIRALERELGAARAHAIVRDALATEFREMAQQWVRAADGPIAEGLGMELSREHTIMQGSDRCDFRYVLRSDE